MTVCYRFFIGCLLLLNLVKCGDKNAMEEICPIEISNFTLSATTFPIGTNLSADLTLFSPMAIDTATVLNMMEFYLSTDPFFSVDDMSLLYIPNQQINFINQQINVHFNIIEIPFIGVIGGAQYLLAYIPEQTCKPDFILPETTRAVSVMVN